MLRFSHRLLAFWIIAAISSGVSEASSEQCASAGKDQAAAALAQAEAAVKHAAAARTLWIPAQEALDKARRAQANGDYRMACREAHSAREFAQLGLEQLTQPLYQH